MRGHAGDVTIKQYSYYAASEMVNYASFMMCHPAVRNTKFK